MPRARHIASIVWQPEERQYLNASAGDKLLHLNWAPAGFSRPVLVSCCPTTARTAMTRIKEEPRAAPTQAQSRRSRGNRNAQAVDAFVGDKKKAQADRAKFKKWQARAKASAAFS